MCYILKKVCGQKENDYVDDRGEGQTVLPTEYRVFYTRERENPTLWV